MRIKDFNISTQLKFGFVFNILFIIVIGIVSVLQNYQLGDQTENMYNHPFQVRSAIGKLNADVLSMRLATRDLMINKTDYDKQAALQLMELSAQDAKIQFDILKNKYLCTKIGCGSCLYCLCEMESFWHEMLTQQWQVAGNINPIY